MIEIYWITRLDTIHQVCEVLIGVFVLVVFFYVLFAISGDFEFYDSRKDTIHKIKRIFKLSCVLIIPVLLVKAFLPTKEEALIIYGVGGTIDYIKQNPSVKELPDKCVEAIDLWLEKYNKKDE